MIPILEKSDKPLFARLYGCTPVIGIYKCNGEFIRTFRAAIGYSRYTIPFSPRWINRKKHRHLGNHNSGKSGHALKTWQTKAIREMKKMFAGKTHITISLPCGVGKSMTVETKTA